MTEHTNTCGESQEHNASSRHCKKLPVIMAADPAYMTKAAPHVAALPTSGQMATDSALCPGEAREPDSAYKLVRLFRQLPTLQQNQCKDWFTVSIRLQILGFVALNLQKRLDEARKNSSRVQSSIEMIKTRIQTVYEEIYSTEQQQAQLFAQYQASKHKDIFNK
ncbi:unnamed protein product [Meganyctiphanes norvegica]|uniref:BLOC-1-related complex subunit 5 n=1 Tax=Meganyctiphanes norvegica TaxID=48144 RepID=A0AAV2SRI2_MEGNR